MFKENVYSISFNSESSNKAFSLQNVEYRNTKRMIWSSLHRDSRLQETLYHLARLLHLNRRKLESGRIFHRLYPLDPR